MQRRQFIGAVATFAAEGGLEVSGIVNMPLAITLWCVAGGLMLWAFWPSIRKRMKGGSMVEKDGGDIYKDESVTSYNQQGGITARNVSIQPSDRKLSTNVEQQLKDHLSKATFKKIEVNAIMGDAEAFRFASQIKDYLVSEGYEIHGVNQVMYASPVQGQIFEGPDDKGVARIIIGGR